AAAGLAVDLEARAAGAPARLLILVAGERVAALDHEVGDDAVEAQAVVERLLVLLAGLGVGPLLRARRQADEVRDGVGGVVLVQLDDDGALVGLDIRLLHLSSSCWAIRS